MRINSNRTQKVLGFLYVLCLLSILFDLILLNAEGSINEMLNLSPFALILLVFLIYRGLPVFSYDSDGEVLNFTAEEPNLRWLGKSFVTHFEFPKRKLVKFRIHRWPFRRTLNVFIDSKAGHLKKQKISISYLSKREVRDLKKSLSGVVARNAEN